MPRVPRRPLPALLIATLVALAAAPAPAGAAVGGPADGGAAAATSAGLAPASARSAAAPGPTASDFVQRIPSANVTSAHAAANGWRTLPARQAPKRFDLLGVRWAGARAGGERDATSARVDLRVRRDGNRWSGWMRTDPSEEPLAGGDGANAPVWTGPADEYQLRVSQPLRDVRVRFVAVAHALKKLQPVAEPAAAAGGVSAPRIVPRSEWDPGDSCRPRTTPSYGRVDFAMVHHTDSINDYSPAESAAIVLAMCKFHVDGNGWNDIGYNLLVDRYGTIFEGRAGGVDQPVVGAHAQGYNSDSTGVAVIGTFNAAPPPQAAMHSLARVLAWKLSLAGVPATGAITEVSGGGPLNAHPRGERVRLNRISGHRDGDATDCPGDALYAELPRLRSMVAAIGTGHVDRLTISPVGGALGPGGPLQVTGRLALADGTRPIGAPLQVQELTGGTWTAVANVRTSTDGAWAAAIPLARNGRFRIANADASIVSPSIVARVQARVSAHATRTHVQVGTSVVLRGTTTPPQTRVSVLVERKSASGAYADVRRVAGHTTSGVFQIPVRVGRVGLYRFTVSTAADADNAAGSSNPVMVRVAPSPQGAARPGKTR